MKRSDDKSCNCGNQVFDKTKVHFLRESFLGMSTKFCLLLSGSQVLGLQFVGICTLWQAWLL